MELPEPIVRVPAVFWVCFSCIRKVIVILKLEECFYNSVFILGQFAKKELMKKELERTEKKALKAMKEIVIIKM